MNRTIRNVFSVVLMAIVACTMLMPKKVFALGITSGTTAKSTERQTVYSGPGTDYVTVGTIESGQQVYILDKEYELSWYHIVYALGNEGAQNSGYVPVNKLTNLTGEPVYERIYNGHQGYMTSGETGSTSSTMEVVCGSVNAGEGVTILDDRAGEYWHYFEQAYMPIYFIEYSTSQGPKRAYFDRSVKVLKDTSSIARVLHNADLYYGNDASIYAKAGVVYANEYVTVLAKNGDWVYVEFNTNQGRRRGYFSQGHLKFHNRLEWYPDLYNYQYVPLDVYVTGKQTVYAGPNSTYVVVGSVTDMNVKFFPNSTTDGYTYIEYELSSGLKKSGWINKTMS